MTSPQIESFLSSFVNYENNLDAVDQRAFRLERVNALLGALGGPQTKYPSIHVAGTNGKGSVCAFTESVLRAAGYRTGLYLSPHLVSLGERVRIDGKPLADEDFYSLITERRDVIERFRQTAQYGRLTYFEALTALAFCAFARAGVEVAVLETGLGGRLDATNTVSALGCGITPIGLEHTKQLGATLEEIAREKSAIIKPGANVFAVSAPQDSAALNVIEARCREVGVPLTLVGREVTVEKGAISPEGQAFRVQTPRAVYDLRTRLVGDHQAQNAAMSVALIEGLIERGFSVSPENISDGISSAVLAGRFELRGTGPAVVLDIAHNPPAFERLKQTLEEIFPEKKINVVLGISADKDVPAILRQVNGFAAKVFLTKSRHPRAADLNREELKALLPSTDEVFFVEDVVLAVERAVTQSQKGDVVLITGSVYTVGEAMAFLNKDKQYGTE